MLPGLGGHSIAVGVIQELNQLAKCKQCIGLYAVGEFKGAVVARDGWG